MEQLQKAKLLVHWHGAPEAEIELTAIEFDLLLALCRRPGRVLPRESMLSEAGRGPMR